MGRLLDELIARRGEVLACLARHRASNTRVFGSVARGEEGADSDIDLLVAFDAAASLFDAFAQQDDLEAMLARRVDVVTAAGLHALIRAQVAQEARAL